MLTTGITPVPATAAAWRSVNSRSVQGKATWSPSGSR